MVSCVFLLYVYEPRGHFKTLEARIIFSFWYIPVHPYPCFSFNNSANVQNIIEVTLRDLVDGKTQKPMPAAINFF